MADGLTVVILLALLRVGQLGWWNWRRLVARGTQQRAAGRRERARGRTARRR